MADYWTVDYNWDTSDSVDSPNKLRISTNCDKIYARGEDIDFNEFLRRSGPRRLKCIIENTEFKNVNLESTSNIAGYDSRIEFKNCVISDFQVIGLNIPFLEFSKCTIENLEILSNTTIEEFIISNQSVINKVNVDNANQIESFKIKNLKSSESINISDTRIENLFIEKSTFTGFCFNQNQYLLDLHLNENSFKEICFEDITINRNLEITDCKTGDIEFILCKLESELFKFTGNNITLSLNKVRTSKKKIFDFNESYNSKIKFDHCYFPGEVQFIGKINPQNKNFIINYTVFKDLVIFDDDHCKGLVIKESLFQNGLLLPIPLLSKSIEISSSVWCILKNQALDRNDNISAFEYRKLELLSYAEELKGLKAKRAERFVLFLNRISNNHGINWILGIGFTISVWLIFYVLFVMAENNFYCLFHKDCSFILFNNEFWANAINYLWIPQGLTDLATGLSNGKHWISSIIMIFSFLMGKILIAYGIFQTISAFRRHGKL